MGRAGVSTGGCLTPQLGTPGPLLQVPLQTESRPQTAGAIGRLPGGPVHNRQFPLGDAGAPTLGWALTESR